MPTKPIVVTDSSCDLTPEQLEQYNIRFVPLRVVCQHAEYRDRLEINEDALYELMKRELPKSSLPLPEDVSNLYDALLAEGYTDVLHITLSSGLSGTYPMVRMVAQEYEGRLNVRVLDGMTLSTGLGMQVLEAARAICGGATIEEAAQRAQHLRQNQLGMFVIRTLEYLRKGGRIGLVEGVVGTLLQIKPVIFVNDDGVYQTLTKARGYKSAVDAMVRELAQKFGQEKISLSVVHGHAVEDALALLERLKSTFNVVDSFIAPVSPVLAIHTGEGLLGIVANRVE